MSKAYLDLLISIQNGKRNFDGQSDLHGFQPVADLLREANIKGHVSGLDLKKESRTGNRYYCAGIVHGLTESGDLFVKESLS